MLEKRYDAAHTYFAPDYRDHGPDGARSPEDATEVFRRTRAAFPDIQVTVDDLVEEGDCVAFRGRFRGTHLGEFAGLAATGAAVDFEALELFRLAGSKIVESWGYWPDALILAQLRAPSSTE